MRSKFTPIYTFFACLSIAFLMISSSGGRNGAWANAPGDSGFCQNCHSGSETIPTGGIELTNLPSNIVAGTTYEFTITLTKPDVLSAGINGQRGGFQLTATNGTNNTLVGSFNTVSGETKLNNISRLVQSMPKNFGGGNTVSWDVEWKSDMNDNLPDDIVFYAAGNAADGNGGSGSSDYSYSTSQSVDVGAGLAVDFLNFTTQNVTEGIRLNWSVSNENQTAYYSIERSVNGKDFTQIATQTAATQTNQYQFIDTDLVKNQIYYYRIQEVATDGKNTFSTIETATYRTLAAEVIAYPNPATTDAAVQVKLPANFAGTVQLVNVQGQVVYTQKIATQLSELALPTTNLAAGVYQLILQDGSEVYQQKLVIR